MREEIDLRPTTERVGGGSSARLAAAVAAAALVAVVWYGASGRSEVAPADGSPGPTSAAVSSLPPSALASPPLAPSEPAPTFPPELLGRGTVIWGDDAFGVAAWLDGRFYMSVLREVEPGHLRTSMRLHFNDSTMPAEMDIIQLWTREERPALAPVAHFDLPPNWLVSGAVPQVVLLESAAAQPEELDAPRMTRQGYLLQATVNPVGSQSYLTVDIRLNALAEPRPGERADGAPRLEAHLRRDDRLLTRVRFGGRPPGVMTAHVIVHQRYGPSPTLSLVHRDENGDQLQVLAEIQLDRSLLRRGHPESLEGEFVLHSVDGSTSSWEYGITPHGTGAGVLLLIQVEHTPEIEVVGPGRLLLMTRDWVDYGRRGSAAQQKWSCWTDGKVC